MLSDMLSQAQKEKHSMSPLGCHLSVIETESRMVVAEGWGKGGVELVLNRCRQGVSVCNNEKSSWEFLSWLSG